MAVCCLFFDPELNPPCQVFRIAGSHALAAEQQHRLEERYCRRGTFIACPLYQRVERCLQEAHLRPQPRQEWRISESLLSAPAAHAPATTERSDRYL
jgi:hypothetical protein